VSTIESIQRNDLLLWLLRRKTERREEKKKRRRREEKRRLHQHNHFILSSTPLTHSLPLSQDKTRQEEIINLVVATESLLFQEKTGQTQQPTPMAEQEEDNGYKYVRPPSPKAPSKTEQRIRQFEAELEGPKLDLNKIRAASFSGSSFLEVFVSG